MTMTVQEGQELGAKVDDIIRNVRTRKFGYLARLSWPKPSEEYQMFKEEALKHVPEIVYEIVVQRYVADSCECEFVSDLMTYNSDRFKSLIYSQELKAKREAGWAEHESKHLVYLSSPFRWNETGGLWGLRNAQEVTRGAISDHRSEETGALSRISKFKRKVAFFDALLQRFPEYKDPNQLIENEQIRLKALDTAPGFSIDYRRVLHQSLLAAGGHFEHIYGLDRLIAKGYQPAIDYSNKSIMGCFFD